MEAALKQNLTGLYNLVNNESINNISCSEVLDGLDEKDQVAFDIYFYTNNGAINLLHTVVRKSSDKFVI